MNIFTTTPVGAGDTPIIVGEEEIHLGKQHDCLYVRVKDGKIVLEPGFYYSDCERDYVPGKRCKTCGQVMSQRRTRRVRRKWK